MVDQAKVGGRASDGPNGAKSAPRAVAHNMAELAHDALTLGELQYELLRCDINQALGRVVVPLALLVGSGVLLLSCVPLALAVVGLFIAQYTDLSYALAFLITLAGGLIAGGLILVARPLAVVPLLAPFGFALQSLTPSAPAEPVALS